MKESVIKADGRALNIPLTEVTAGGGRAGLSGKSWFVREVDIDRGYQCCVATETECDATPQLLQVSCPDMETTGLSSTGRRG